MDIINLFHYDFILKGMLAGLVIAVIAPAIGTFLVLKRYSLIADTLSHVSLAGIALGLMLKINPIFTAIGATTIASILIDRLRLTKKVYGESALSLFLSGSLAVAVVLIGLSNGFNTSLFNFLFGSIATVTTTDIYTVLILGLAVLIILAVIHNELLYITFDEDAARVSNIPVNTINLIFVVLAAVTISLSIPIVGILLISALLVIPVITAMQFKKSFLPTLFIAQAISIISVFSGIVISFYFNLATGGTIVLVSIFFFVLAQIITARD